jgi:nitrite reductase (NADH) large subunit
MAADLFRVYTRMPERVPRAIWRLLRWGAAIGALGLAILCVERPAVGLRVFWASFVPLLSALFLVAPGLWRNVCPMATLNQIPRTLRFTRGRKLSPQLQQVTPLISLGLFLAIVPLRKVMLERSGVSLGSFVLLMLAAAFVGGVLFKAKSGWCSSFCPLAAIERFYGQAPLTVVRNDHCRPRRPRTTSVPFLTDDLAEPQAASCCRPHGTAEDSTGGCFASRRR